MNVSSGYKEQYGRVQRWHTRFQTLDAGREHNVSSDNYVDEIYAFFMNCFHLKDWIKHDRAVSTPVRDAVEDYVNSERALCLCADICNSLKHLELVRSRSGEGPTFGKKAFGLVLGPGEPPVISLKYEIETASGPVDAFQLATECVASWDAFLANNGLK